MFQDALHKKASNDSFFNAVQLALDSVNQAKQCIFTNSTEIVTLDYVESVAKFRYTLETVAYLLHDYYLDPAHFNVLSKPDRRIIAQLLASVQDMCSAINKDTNEVVPNLLIKCIVRKYGMSTLITLCDISKTEGSLDFAWLMPKHLQNITSEEQVSLRMWYCTVGNFRGSNFYDLGSSDNFVGLYFWGIPTLIT